MKHARIVLFYIIAAIAVLYARTAQLLYLTEADSGFFKSDNTLAATAVTAFMVLATAATGFIAMMSRRAPKGAPELSPPLMVGYFVLAMAFIYESFFVDYVTNATLFVLLTRFFAFASAVSCLLFAFRPLFGTSLGKKISILTLCPVFFFLFKLVSVFTVYATISVIVSNVFYLLFLCFALLFFLLFTKTECNIEPTRSMISIFPISLVTSIVSLCCVIPQCITLLLGKSNLVHDNPHDFVCCLAVAVFSIIYSMSLYSKKNLANRKRKTHPLKVGETYKDLSSQFYTDQDKK